MEIMFGDNHTDSQLRNGMIITTGILDSKYQGYTTINAINSKGNAAVGYIKVPNEFWVGNAVEALLEKKDLLPLLIGIHPLLDTLISEKLKE